MGRGEFALAKEHLMAASEKPSIGWNPIGDHEVYVLLADIGALHRDKELLSAYALRSNEISLALNHHLYHAIALRALAILDWLDHNFARAEERLKESRQLFQRLETHWQIGRTLFDLGELSAGMGKHDEANIYFAQAQSAFRIMGVRSNMDIPN
jgi:hypothetical protein